jgi:hypothetical protein
MNETVHLMTDEDLPELLEALLRANAVALDLMTKATMRSAVSRLLRSRGGWMEEA